VRWLCVVLLAGCPSAEPEDMAVADFAFVPFCDDNSPPLAPTYNNVTRLFSLYCTGCHYGTQVDLTKGQALATLIRRAVPQYFNTDETCGGALVIPYDAGVSYLYEKVSQATPCAGQQMPLGETGTAVLDTCAQNLIRDWINAGAPGP
jgi:hypothetical protein